MHDLPSGTVTFLFTDMEGSTRLLQRTRERYAELLRLHGELIRTACRAHGGHEMGTEGEAFFFAFSRARDALEAAVAAQRALTAHRWPPDAAVRVRMGIHTGEPDVGEEGYLGLALHRVARISDAGNGGQILVSRATAELLEDELLRGLSLRDLGVHRLRDFDRPQRIFQVVADGLPSEFAPLRGLEAQPERSISGALEERLVSVRAKPESGEQRQPLHRRPLVLAMLAGTLAAAVSIPVFAWGGDQADVDPVDGNVLVSIDPATNTRVDVIPVGARPADVVAADGSLWVANIDDETVMRVDPVTHRVIRTFSTGATPSALAATADAVWIVTSDPSATTRIGRIKTLYNSLESFSRIGGALYGGGDASAAAGGGAVWVAPGGVGMLSRIDAATGTPGADIEAGSCCPASVAHGAGATWAADPYRGTVSRIGSKNVVERTIELGGGPTGLAVDDRRVWVPLELEATVARIDTATNTVDERIDVGRSPVAVAFGAGSAWVVNSRDGTVSRIDQRSKDVATIEVGGTPQAIAFAAGKAWVTVQRSDARVEDEGVARFTVSRGVGSLDPALAYAPLGQSTIARAAVAWQIEYATCAKLLNYPDRPAPAGSQLVPEVAASMPTLSPDRRTYTFRIRKGFGFSPPSRESVTAGTFKFAIERSLSPAINGPASVAAVRAGLATAARATLNDVVGASLYANGRARHIAGITARGMTLRIRLVRPAGDFLHRLAMPFFCAVPRDAPLNPRGARTIASAGPYYVASYSPDQTLVLRRNPRYGGRRPHHLREMRVRFGVGQQEAVREVERGSVDYALDGVPASERVRLSRRYGRGPASTRRYLVNPTLDLWFAALNVSRPAFADARVRRAANYAIDRAALANLDLARFLLAVRPTDQYLPPGMPGFRDARIYPSSPDLAAARRLMAGRRVKAVLYTCVLICRSLADAVENDLEKVGIEVETQEHPIAELRGRLGTRGEPFDLAFTGWNADYPDPSAFFDALFDGSRLRPRENANIAYLDDPAVNRELRRIRSLTGRARSNAYGRLDIALARDVAPLVAVGYRASYDFFSARMGCHVYHPVYGIDLARLCMRPGDS